VGWQRQTSGVSIQGLLEDALGRLDEAAVTVHGAGRTDAGVHALGQVAAFSLTRTIAASGVARALNARLPESVRVLDAEEVPADFHPRFAARSKTYRYRIWTGEVVSPFERRYVWHVGGALDLAAMDAAARMLEGRHDFAAFQSVGTDTTSTERTLFESAIGRSGMADSVITYDVSGDGFLRHMVRAIVGTLVDIGRGHRPPEWMREVLASRNRAAAGPTAPAAGLFLVRVEY
jgi:tRNA pseudouridine38-40 synthase